MATRLEKLGIEEVSGVENPANELPGWLVMKSKDKDGNLDVDTLLKEVDRAESDFAILYSALKACEQYLGDAPADVQGAKDTLVSYIEQLFDANSADAATDPTADPQADPGQVQASKDKDSEGILGKAAKLFKRDDVAKTEEPEAEVEKAEAEEPEAEPAAKSEEQKPEAETEPEPTQKSEDLEALITKAIAPVLEGQEVLANALNATVDRVSNLEARRMGIDPDLEETTKSKEGGALRAALTQVAHGGSVQLG